MRLWLSTTTECARVINVCIIIIQASCEVDQYTDATRERPVLLRTDVCRVVTCTGTCLTPTRRSRRTAGPDHRRRRSTGSWSRTTSHDKPPAISPTNTNIFSKISHEFFSIDLQWKWDHPVSAHYPVRTDNLLHLSPADLPHSRIVMSTGWCHFSNFLWGVLIPGRISPRGYLMNCQNPQQSTNKNLAIANKSRLSCAHNSSRTSVITLWPWNLG